MKVTIFWRACLVTSLCVLSGCFQWTEDSQGKLQSAGLPGIPLWQSKAPPAPINPTEFGFTQEEASKMSGAVLVMPTTNSGMMRYKYYQTGQNHCEDDLKKLLADRAAKGNSTDPAPYCTDNPTRPALKGNAFLF